MKATNLHIHNFRSFLDSKFELSEYSILLGVNNSGKSNLIDAIRIFYDKDLKFDENRDFPKFKTNDSDSWIEIEYVLEDDEINLLKNDYKSDDNTLKLRKYLKSSEKDNDGKIKSGIYFCPKGESLEIKFYGNKNASQGYIGEIIYIPAVSKLDDQVKMTGPSPLRDLVNSVFNKILESSNSYKQLNESFDRFYENLKDEETDNGLSIKSIENDISEEIIGWGTRFSFSIQKLSPDVIVKTLIDFKLNDENLKQIQDHKSYGQGFQRNLIFTLIKLSAKYNTSKKVSVSKEFSTQFTWLLFEEPEAFLHPSQIELLNSNLKNISKTINQQVLITTHNPIFVSKNIEDIPSLIRLFKELNISNIGQLNNNDVEEIFNANIEETKTWRTNKRIDNSLSDEDLEMEMEAIKHSLWLDPRRCNAFFANKVLLVEGPTEVAIINYLLENRNVFIDEIGIFVLDSMGKFNIHRFMKLFSKLKIYHSVLFDRDNDKYLNNVDQSIYRSKNQYTIKIDSFPVDIENFLNICKKSKDKKPQYIMWCLKQGKIKTDKLDELEEKIKNMLEK